MRRPRRPRQFHESFVKFEIFFSVSSGEDLSGGRRSQKEEEERSLVYIYIYIPRPYTSLFFVYINLNLSDRELSSSFVDIKLTRK